jgi:hypothetical protein
MRFITENLHLKQNLQEFSAKPTKLFSISVLSFEWRGYWNTSSQLHVTCDLPSHNTSVSISLCWLHGVCHGLLVCKGCRAAVLMDKPPLVCAINDLNFPSRNTVKSVITLLLDHGAVFWQNKTVHLTLIFTGIFSNAAVCFSGWYILV